MSSLQNLSPAERDLVRECLRAVASGPFLQDEEFHTLMGCHRAEFVDLVHAWPPDESSRDVRDAIQNALNNLTGYPHGCEAVWSEFVSAPPEEVERVFAKWLDTR